MNNKMNINNKTNLLMKVLKISIIALFSMAVVFIFVIMNRSAAGKKDDAALKSDIMEKVVNDAVESKNGTSKGNDNMSMGHKKIEYEEYEKNKERASQLYDRIITDFSVPGTNYLKYYVPSKPSEKEIAYLWPYMQAYALANTMLELDMGNTAYKENLLKIIGGLENYRSTFSDEVCYQSYPTEFGGGDTFYDDNIWIANELFRSYKILGDEAFLTTAEGIFTYVTGGWNEKTGGLYWKEANCSIMTTCTNAPTAIVALKLYKETGYKSYFDWSLKIYKWVKSNLLSENGVFWDHIDENGYIEKTTWTYNTGMMISAAMALYDTTGNVEYLNDAEYYAKSAYSWFPKADKNTGLYLYPDTPWFNLLLLQGFIDLYKANGNYIYIDSIKSNLDYAWKYNMTSNGYIYPGLNEGLIQEYKYNSLLDQASIAECYAKIALLEKYK